MSLRAETDDLHQHNTVDLFCRHQSLINVPGIAHRAVVMLEVLYPSLLGINPSSFPTGFVVHANEAQHFLTHLHIQDIVKDWFDGLVLQHIRIEKQTISLWNTF